MSNTINSSNMALPIPVVGMESGPDYATDVNNCLTIIDQHDHSPGAGVQITPSGININSDLTMGSNNLTTARTLRFDPQTGTLSDPSDLGCLYEVGVDLYYNDGSGNQVRITQSGGVAGSPGSIANLTSPASASYVSASNKFVWQSDANTAADMDGGAVILRNITANSFGVTLQPPNALSSDYSITLPALPPSTAFVSISSSGALASTISTTQGITYAMLAAAVQQALNPPGSVTSYAGASVPSGYLLCDGSAVSRSTYSALFAAIGEAWGEGDNSTTFNLPDLRGYFLRGVTGLSSNDPDASSRTASNTGGNTGNNVGSVQLDEFKSHTHTLPRGTGLGGTKQYFHEADTGDGTLTSDASGGAETRPKNAYVNFIIKT